VFEDVERRRKKVGKRRKMGVGRGRRREMDRSVCTSFRKEEENKKRVLGRDRRSDRRSRREDDMGGRRSECTSRKRRERRGKVGKRKVGNGRDIKIRERVGRVVLEDRNGSCDNFCMSEREWKKREDRKKKRDMVGCNEKRRERNRWVVSQ